MRGILWVVGVCCACEEATLPKGVEIGSTSVEIDTRMVVTRVGEAAIGDWMADTLLAATRARGQTVDVAAINSGAIRGGPVDANFQFVDDAAKLGKIYPVGPLTDLDVAGWFPFRDDHTLITLTGTQLKSVLERAVAQLPPDLRMDLGGPFLQIAGARYTIGCAGAPQRLSAMNDAIAAEGSRITKIEIGGQVIFDSGVDRLATTSVRIVINSFLAGGLDGHLAFKDGAQPEVLPIASFNFVEVMRAEVRKSSPIAPRTDGRIAVIGECGKPLTLP